MRESDFSLHDDCERQLAEAQRERDTARHLVDIHANTIVELQREVERLKEETPKRESVRKDAAQMVADSNSVATECAKAFGESYDSDTVLISRLEARCARLEKIEGLARVLAEMTKHCPHDRIAFTCYECWEALRAALAKGLPTLDEEECRALRNSSPGRVG